MSFLAQYSMHFSNNFPLACAIRTQVLWYIGSESTHGRCPTSQFRFLDSLTSPFLFLSFLSPRGVKELLAMGIGRKGQSHQLAFPASSSHGFCFGQDKKRLIQKRKKKKDKEVELLRTGCTHVRTYVCSPFPQDENPVNRVSPKIASLILLQTSRQKEKGKDIPAYSIGTTEEKRFLESFFKCFRNLFRDARFVLRSRLARAQNVQKSRLRSEENTERQTPKMTVVRIAKKRLCSQSERFICRKIRQQSASQPVAGCAQTKQNRSKLGILKLSS